MTFTKLTLFLILSFASVSSYASMCTTHSTTDNKKTTTKLSYNIPCEISDTILMASSEEICQVLKEKISNHDHD